jgi:guanine nucleotide-binding protein subunit alpha
MAHVLVEHELSPHDRMPVDYLEPVKALWADGGVRSAVELGNEYALHDNLT